MDHPRTTIRNALVARLTGLATCGSRVYGSRLRPLIDADLPAILVSTNGEAVDPPQMLSTNRVAMRRLRCQLDIVVKSKTNFETVADTILLEIENALFDTAAHNNLGGVALSISLAGIDDTDVDFGIETPACRLPVVLEVNYIS